jgi:hypothetical protein
MHTTPNRKNLLSQNKIFMFRFSNSSDSDEQSRKHRVPSRSALKVQKYRKGYEKCSAEKSQTPGRSVPAQTVDATPSNALIRLRFPDRTHLFDCTWSNPSQGTVPAVEWRQAKAPNRGRHSSQTSLSGFPHRRSTCCSATLAILRPSSD